jgi:hypothetical protein
MAGPHDTGPGRSGNSQEHSTMDHTSSRRKAAATRPDRQATDVATPRAWAELLEGRVLLANAADFFLPAQTQGVTPVTLHPVESVAPNRSTRVSFGVPFPKGFVTDLSKVRLLNAGGAEQAVHVASLSPWRDLGTLSDLPSVRSALVQANVSFPDVDGDGDADPVSMNVEWGKAARTVPALAPAAARAGWVLVNDASYSSAHNVYEPPAYAVFTPQWYGDAVLKTRLQPFGTDAASATYDAAFKNFGDTAINNVDPRVTEANRIHYTTDFDPWLFDRTTTLQQLGFRSGDVKFLREAHRAAQFYANHITAGGYFDLRGNDMKYVYGEGIAADYWLTGDDRLLDVHHRMIPQFDGFNAAYTSSTGFWTERHAAFKLAGYTTGFELLGDAALGQKAKDTFTAYLNHQTNPVPGAPANGLLMHTSASHGEGGSEFVASPWMTTLLVDAAERYYIQSGDTRVKTFVTRIAEGVNRLGESIYFSTGFDGVNRLMPYYLAGANLTAAQHMQDPFADAEHALDVSKIFALAYHFSRVDGAPNASFLGRFNELTSTANAEFAYWTRPSGPQSGLSVYRLSPPRKFNWWFRTTADNDRLVRGPLGTTTPQEIVTSASGLDVPEGGSASFTVRLAAQPAGDVLVSLSKAATGDVDLTAATSSLTFTPANWNVARSVAIAAAEDADATNGAATFTLSSTGLTSKSVAATEVDNDVAPPPPPAGPRVTDVFVGSKAWGPAFNAFLQSSGAGEAAAGFRIGDADPLNELPWTNLNRVSIRFSQPVNVAADDLVVRGVGAPAYALAAANAFAYDAATNTATWTLAASLRNERLLLDLDAEVGAGVTNAAGHALDGEWADPAVAADQFPSGDGAAGGDFQFRLHVLPGDVDRDGAVRANDAVLVRGAQGGAAGSAAYSIFKDVNGSGAIQGTDVMLVRDRIGDTLPAGSPRVGATAIRVSTPSRTRADAGSEPAAVAPVLQPPFRDGGAISARRGQRLVVGGGEAPNRVRAVHDRVLALTAAMPVVKLSAASAATVLFNSDEATGNRPELVVTSL